MSNQQLAVVDGAFSQEQVDIIRSQVAPPGTTNEELRLFLMYCQRTNLDPFARQIYLSERRSQKDGQWFVTRKPETTIDGFRVCAERTGQYAGQVGPEWCGKDGQWRDVWLEDAPPAAARVGVLRHDFKEPIYSVALYKEYVQTTSTGPNSMWKRMPANQLAKCAESLSLRRAFPRELSGLYTREEMGQQENEPEPRGSQAAADAVAVEKIEKLQKGKTLPDDPPELAAYLERIKKPIERNDTYAAMGVILHSLGGDQLMNDAWASANEGNPKPDTIVRRLWAAIQSNQPPSDTI